MKTLMFTLMLLGTSLHLCTAESPGLEIRPVPATAKFADPAYPFSNFMLNLGAARSTL